MTVRRLLLVLGAATALSSCAKPEHPDWMIGTWAFQRPAATGPQRCSGGTDPRAYDAKGFYLEVDAAEYGRWEIKGKRLIHHVLRVGNRVLPVREQGDYIFRINDRSPDRLDVNRGPDEQMTMLRCDRTPDTSMRAPAPLSPNRPASR